MIVFFRCILYSEFLALAFCGVGAGMLSSSAAEHLGQLPYGAYGGGFLGYICSCAVHFARVLSISVQKCSICSRGEYVCANLTYLSKFCVHIDLVYELMA
jgi:hypothetical protein